MAKKAKPLPRVAQRECDAGIVHTYDSGGRLCLDIENRERIVLVHDLRTYGDGLHIGALGWTIPETTDGYTFADVLFDTGQKLRLKRYAFERVTVEAANTVAAELVSRNRNTRFDADPGVAASCREDWIAKYYGDYLTLFETIVKGVGDQELYAFTFPSLIELARLKGQDHYPVKIGFQKTHPMVHSAESDRRFLKRRVSQKNPLCFSCSRHGMVGHWKCRSTIGCDCSEEKPLIHSAGSGF